MRYVLTTFLFLCAASSAWAQSSFKQPDGSTTPGHTQVPAYGPGAYSSASIGATSAQCVAANAAKTFLDIVNDSPTATMAIAFGGPAVINGAGSYTLPPLWHRSWEGTFVPTDAVNCIASVAGTPATIGVK